MKKMEEGNKLILFPMLVFVTVTVQAKQAQSPTNQLNKVFYHEFNDRRQDNPAYYMEYGKVVFYFDQDFDMPPLKRSNGKQDHDTIVFHFPGTVVKTDECKKMVKELNQKKSPLYSFNIETNGSKGMTFSISFDAKKIDVDIRSFDSIGLQKGLAFNLINKTLLEELAHKVNPILRTACLEKKPHIVIDCGHGGQDSGTISFSGIKEKDVTLQIGLQLAQFLQQQGITTHLTRQADVTMALDERTLFANSFNDADLLVSIHANNASSTDTCGVETFYLKPTLLVSQVSTCDQKKKSLINTMYTQLSEKSVKLATAIHDMVVTLAQEINNRFVNRAVKSSVTQVLMGCQMPSALIEVGFLSNPHEAQLLVNSDYQQCIARAIGTGILSYLKQA